MSEFASVDVSSMNKAGPASLASSKFIEKLIAALENTKAVDEANAAAAAIKRMVEGMDTWAEPYLLLTLGPLLANFANNKTAESAKVAGEALLAKLNPTSMRVCLDILYSSMGSMKWQTKKGALVLLGSMSKLQVEVVQKNIPAMLLKLIEMASDVKKEVKEQVKICFHEICSCITNVDIIPVVPKVIPAYTDPAKNTEAALDALVATSFINDVDTPTLGFLVPILTKGMRERKVAVKRRAAVVIGNMCKLVTNPQTAAQFYPILKPVLERGIEEIQVEEVRKQCQLSVDTLERVASEAAAASADILDLEGITAVVTKEFGSASGLETLMTHIAKCCHALIAADDRTAAHWNLAIAPYASVLHSEEKLVSAVAAITAAGTAALSAEKVDLEDEEEDLCNAQFSLAYGTRVLLHQTPFRVKVGRKYGVVGPNGAGKSTLMKSIAGGNLHGFPTDLRTVYVECEIIGEKADMTCLEYIQSDDKIIQQGVTAETTTAMLTDMGFGKDRTSAAIDAGVSTLSGGWRMKLALSRAMLLAPDMLMLDEPTNHLDQFAVKWLTDYIKNLKRCTCLLISHDTKFLDAVCTNILHYENLKLKVYKGNLSDFVKTKPEAKAYYELSSDLVEFRFPEPGPLEGVKSLTKAVLKTKNIFFQYPAAPLPQLIDVSIQCSLASRVAVVGVNGAGKSTLVKLMVGEIEPDQGTIEKHPNLRVAYVAQHAFAHIEQHLDKTPIEYIMWRYRGGQDKEMMKKDAVTMSEEDIKAIRKKAVEDKTGIIEEIKGRRTGKREHEYEVIWEGLGREDSWHSRTELLQMGYKKMLDEKDEQIAMESMLGQRKLTTGEIQKHLDYFGLEPQFAEHTRMGALSGGQKVKVVLGAGLWNLPHLVILDEPTNFLDRDSLAALAGAIKEFKGGIFMISHNAEFYEALCPEKWILESGRLTVMGAEWMEEVEKARKKAEKLAKRSLNFNNEEVKKDALGNDIVKVEGEANPAELSRADRKMLMKQRKEMLKHGEDTYDIDLKLGIE